MQAVVTFEYTSSRQRCLEVYRPGTWAWLCQAHALRLAGKRVMVRGKAFLCSKDDTSWSPPCLTSPATQAGCACAQAGSSIL